MSGDWFSKNGTPLNKKMNRQPPYSDLNASPYGASQMQMKQLMTPRMQENTENDYFQGPPDFFPAAVNVSYISENDYFQGPPDSFPAAVNVSYISSQWNRDVPEVPNSNQMLAQLYPDGQVKTVLEKQANSEAGLQSHEQDMEIGYGDKPRRLTFEDLEKKFQDEVLKLIEEQIHSEDAENTRHREKIIEIKNLCQEKLLALRAQQARRREEFLKKESEERLEKYHQSEFGNPSVVTSSFHGYAGPIPTEAHHHTDHFDSYYRDQSPHLTKNQGTVERVPYPRGRVYNNTGARFW